MPRPARSLRLVRERAFFCPFATLVGTGTLRSLGSGVEFPADIAPGFAGIEPPASVPAELEGRRGHRYGVRCKRPRPLYGQASAKASWASWAAFPPNSPSRRCNRGTHAV